MKTKMIQIISAAAATGLFVGVASTQITGDYMTGIAVTVGYLAVAALVILTVADYRRQVTYTA